MLSSLKHVALALTVAACGFQAAAAADYSQIVVFGDSLSDAGNIFAATGGATPAAPYYNGRFSNGPTWIDRIAATQGITLVPSLLGGTDYAFGGARVLADVPVNANFSIPSLPHQLAAYLAAANRADAQALYVIWGGGNDAFNATPATAATIPDAYARTIRTMVTTLRHAGARNILVLNTPNTGTTPVVRAQGPVAQAASTALDQAMDVALRRALREFTEDERPAVRLVDIFGIVNGVTLDPGGFGFTNTTDPCLTSSGVCADPAHNFFWDTVHPTVFGHDFFAIAARTVLDPAARE